ncbi:MAG: prepilin-type N-terminal cleavage/methylation domain-containing protein [Acidobacteriia bacterium]|nr:prepilin-type N-terminal cleavage/methylation domain-containing protein [Terriglobia bacterium]
MKNEQGFSLVELLIVVAIIAIIAAIAVPSLLTSRMAANEASGIEGCRTAASAEVAFSSTNNQNYTTLADLVTNNFLDSRYVNAAGFNGYIYTEDTDPGLPSTIPYQIANGGFGIAATAQVGYARFNYGIGPDQVVRYTGHNTSATADPVGLVAGDPIGKK